MPEYIMLFRYTTKGVQAIKDAPTRINNVRKLFEQNNAKVKSFYAVLGQYDTVCIAEAPDDETIAKISLQISSLGNVQGETLRAFTEDQMVKIVNQIP
jgi:uncharacterized protein with GYD domain